MKTSHLYSANQISTAAAKVFNLQKGIDTSVKMLQKTTNKNANCMQFTWNEVNYVLWSNNWSPRHILMMLNNL
jgi:hypothetical protein